MNLSAEAKSELQSELARLEPEQDRLWAAYQALANVDERCAGCGQTIHRPGGVERARDEWSCAYRRVEAIKLILTGQDGAIANSGSQIEKFQKEAA